MRMHRIELLLSAAEMERIEREAATLGISPSEYVSQAAGLLDAEDMKAAKELPSLLPEFNAALDRIHGNLVAIAERSERTHAEIARMHTPEYREEVRRSILEGEAELEPAMLAGDAPAELTPANTSSPPVGQTSHFSKARSQVNEAREPWGESDLPEGETPSK